MEVREIKALISLMDQHDLVELEIEDRKGKVRLVRGAHAPAGTTNSEPDPTPRPAHKAANTKAARPKAGAKPEDEPIELAANQQLVESPMVGMFYRSPSPDAAAFVEEGSSVRKGETVCIIEAMKMMNEIEAPVAGRVVRIIAANGQPVEYGQALMIIEVG
jgi:acetyl-CoA carboxylase biotin carboxyl carrier protein